MPLLVVKPSATSSQYQKKSVFQRLLKATSAARLIEKLGESTTVSEKLTCQVISFIQKTYTEGKLMKNL